MEDVRSLIMHQSILDHHRSLTDLDPILHLKLDLNKRNKSNLKVT